MARDGLDGDGADGHYPFGQMDSIEYLLFDSLVHHMIEKGLLTRKDALSIVQTVARIVRGYLNDDHEGETSAALSKLKRTYASFEAMPERLGTSALDAENVHQLRPPLHGDRPEFPRDD